MEEELPQPELSVGFLINYVGDASVQISAPYDNAKSKDKLSRPLDGFHNMHTLGHETKFIRYLVLYLISFVSCGLLKWRQMSLLNPKDYLIFSYDTSFDLGDCYVCLVAVRF